MTNIGLDSKWAVVENLITPTQCKAARQALGWNVKQLASAAGLSHNTVASFERGARVTTLANMRAILSALRTAGVVPITGENGNEGIVVDLGRRTVAARA